MEVVGCSVVGHHGETYGLFEGAVIVVDIATSASAFRFCEFAGLTAHVGVAEVEAWAKPRSRSVSTVTQPDHLLSVAAMGFQSRWCQRECGAEFSFSSAGRLERIRVVTELPWF